MWISFSDSDKQTDEFLSQIIQQTNYKNNDMSKKPIISFKHLKHEIHLNCI